MKKESLLLVSLVALVVGLSGCTKQEKTVGGALAGAGTGALVGGLAGNGAGAAIGGVTGAGLGALIGNSMGDDE